MMLLRSIDPAKNRFRDYVLDVQPGLFGDWCVITRWGRIGSRGGQERCYWFATEEEARASVQRMLRRRHRHGYVAI